MPVSIPPVRGITKGGASGANRSSSTLKLTDKTRLDDRDVGKTRLDDKDVEVEDVRIPSQIRHRKQTLSAKPLAVLSGAPARDDSRIGAHTRGPSSQIEPQKGVFIVRNAPQRSPDDDSEKSIPNFINPDTAEISEESDAVETLTHLGDGHKTVSPANDPGRSNKSPHLGKGISKFPCKLCQGPIAVKVSNTLRAHNSGLGDNSKMCQKCFNEMCKKNPEKIETLRALAQAHVQKELSFPWALHINPYYCAQTFSDKCDLKVGDKFRIIYNYSSTTLDKCISISITISHLNHMVADLVAQAPAAEFLAMKTTMGREQYHDAEYNEGLGIFEWKWYNISKRVLIHSKLLSAFQEQSGSIKSCNMLFANMNQQGDNHLVFTTTDDAHPVLYPFKNHLDFPIVVQNQFGMELISCSGETVHPAYTHAVFDKNILCDAKNVFGLSIVAVDQKNNVVYLSMKYVAFEEDNGKALTKLHRIIMRANGSDIEMFPCLIKEYSKFLFNPHMSMGSSEFKVLTHLHALFTEIHGNMEQFTA